jgi:peptidoglycan/LPS O-acetylase OafA/YrhL
MLLVTGGLLTLSAMCGTSLGAGYRDGIGFVIDPLLTAALIAQVISFRTNPIAAWLNWPVIRFLGTISYSVYLYQQLVVGPVAEKLASQPVIIQAIGVTVAVAIAGSFSYYVVERPFLKLKDRFQVARL